nr:MAG TPA: hypothetical protein [Caudoviricetes sp.]
MLGVIHQNYPKSLENKGNSTICLLTRYDIIPLLIWNKWGG